MITGHLDQLRSVLADRYRIEREVGQGGMATVYLAHDLRHERKVAIKVLRPELAAVIGADRFVREIRTIAALQHPHILGLIDSGEVGGTAYYVMPFVEGESLRDRLTREKQLPIADALRIATEVASALDYAHRHGVIHRDIKPENILLHDGQALVADFGIALAVSQAGGSRMTETGMSLGTPHYMSPEQAMGEREITARSDVYALGCVTYEMLLGEPPFTGPTAQAIVAKVVTEEPRPLTIQRRSVPEHVEAAVLTALAKLPADRFGTAAEFAGALAGRSDHHTAIRPVGPPAARGRRSQVGLLAGAAVVTLLLGAAGAALWLDSRPSPQPRIQASLLPPAGCGYAAVSLGPPQLSPDGTRLVFVANCAGTSSLWIRTLATGKTERLEGTTAAQYPFWSPEGGSVGFFSRDMLKRIDLDTRAVRILAPAAAGRGGSWSRGGTIVYAPDIFGPLVRVPATGGTPQPATTLSDSGRAGSRVTQRNPYFLPDGEHFLFNQGREDPTAMTRLARLGATDSRQVLDVASNVVYAGNRLMYVKDGVLVGQRFDSKTGKLSGAATALVPSIETYQPRLLGSYTIAGGNLVYQPSMSFRSRIAWFDPRSGREQPILPEGTYAGVAIAPDRRRLLVARTVDDESGQNLWAFDLQGGSWARVTDEKSQSYQFGWFPDAKRFFYSSSEANRPLRIVNTADGAVVDSISREHPGIDPLVSVAPDGYSGVGVRQVEATGFDLLRLDLRGSSRVLQPLLASPANERAPRVSPDGRLLAYLSDRSGRYEVMAAPLPGAGIQWQLTQEGAGFWGAMAWAADGRTLDYVDASGRLSAIDVSVRDGVRFGRPRLVAGTPAILAGVDGASDGRLVLIAGSDEGPVPLTLVTGWQALIQESR